MPSAKRYLLFALSFAVFAATFTMLTPRVVHAITAALVQVVNTSANPVPVTDAGSRFQAAVCNITGAIANAVTPAFCVGGQSTFVVPTTTSTGATVKQLIVDQVSGFCSNYNDPGTLIKAVRLRGAFLPDSVPYGNATFTHYIPIVAPVYSYTNAAGWGPPLANVPESDYTYGQTTHFAFLAGDTVTLDMWTFSVTPTPLDGYCIARVEGHLVTQ